MGLTTPESDYFLPCVAQQRKEEEEEEGPSRVLNVNMEPKVSLP
jgi:hypothetical protein